MSTSVDVAVVGGGISGLYTAWRLSTVAKPPKVALYESSSRLGGRIDTVKLPVPAPGASAEFGAMRFMPFMAIVKNLLDYLGVRTEKFPGGTLRNMFLRNVQIAMDANGNATNSPYNLAPGEPQNGFTLVMNVLNGAAPNATKLTAKQWREITQNGVFKGRPLWEWGMVNVAQELISHEAYNFVYDSLGLDSVLLKTNAAMGLRALAAPLPDYLAGNVFRPVNGFAALIDELEKRLRACPNCSIHKLSPLMAASRAANGINLNFSPAIGPTPPGGGMVTASKVVFAMPPRAMDLIDLDGLFPVAWKSMQRNQLHNKLHTVEGIPAFKICVVCEKPWWQSFTDRTGAKKGWTDGYSVTDLPLRQVFYGMGQGDQPAGNARVLLATYADSDAAQYWEGLSGVSENLAATSPTGTFRTADPGNLRDAVADQLCAILGIAPPLPKPLFVGYMNWAEDPFGGAWHEWRPGVDVSTAIPDMRQPIPDLPLFICGEAYSWLQAWIEGALMSAERMLQDHFELPWPSDWLPVGYDLGP